MKKFKFISTTILFLVFLGIFIPWAFSKTSTPSLDSMMTEEDKTKTGLDKLSVTERIELKNWIDRHYILRSTEVSYRLPEISQVYYGGQYIQLDDDTIWQIHPQDIIFSQAWITPAPIRVEQSANSTYPYTLENTITETKVRARKVSSLPR